MATGYPAELPRAPVGSFPAAPNLPPAGMVSIGVDIIAILLGWPSLVAALLLAATGTRTRRPGLIWGGIVLTLPVAFYVSGSPAYPFIGVAPVLALTVTALTCRSSRRWPAVAGVVVYATFLAALAWVVLGD